MFPEKPVNVSRRGFAFCRYTVAILMWVGAMGRMEWIIILCAVIMLLNVILSIRHAPLILLYANTLDRLFPPQMVAVDANGMRFTQSIAFVFMVIPLEMIHLGLTTSGWRLLLLVALFKTMGALGFCAVSQLYTCLITQNGCCSIMRKKNDVS